MAEDGSAGSLEMYFSPGAKGETYFQWIIRLPMGTFNVYDWNSPHRQFRSLRDHLKTETLSRNGNCDTYIFIPWEVLYEKLPLNKKSGLLRHPFDTGGGDWGARSTNRNGPRGMEKPTPSRRAIRGTSRKSMGKYQKSRDAQNLTLERYRVAMLIFWTRCCAPPIQRLENMVRIKDRAIYRKGRRLYKNVLLSGWSLKPASDCAESTSKTSSWQVAEGRLSCTRRSLWR